MEQKRIPKPGQLYKHFKNKLYQIITVAIHSETGEQMVVYQALYGDFKTYVRPLDMFISEVDLNKYPQAQQKYRFEQVMIISEDKNAEFPVIKEDYRELLVQVKDQIKQDEINRTDDKNTTDEKNTADESDSINPVLLEFLEADTYEEKLAILLNKKKYINDKILNDMAVSIDCTLDDGIIEERISEFAYCLQTHARFENNRLR